MIEIKSNKNPLIKEIRSLYRKKDRNNKGLFIVEGIKMVEEMIDTGYLFKNIVYTDLIFENKDGIKLFSKIENIERLVYVPGNIFREIADTENPQGILGVVNMETNSIKDLESNRARALLYLDRIKDPGNMGTIIRSADAFKIDGIILSKGCVDPYNPKVVRATMGSIFRVPLYFLEEGISEINELKNSGIKVYSSSLEGSLDIGKANFKRPFLIVIGNESGGISDEIYDLSDELIKIPMPGGSESLNAGVAASILMYEAMLQMD